MEGVNPKVTRNVSALASKYSHDVLGMRCTALDEFLCEGDKSSCASSGKRLSASILPELGESHDITTFPRLFFSSLDSDLLTALEDPCEFWVRLPPMHCIRCTLS
ncbi:unnamed protein product [Phytomonas sp. Hart1]|nr:unnamed protein product [Phytomonas sp. Hart1]|eukprot:CCW71986.1 unnamed protein product [Phytomonas sp. isolate Hart1]